MKAMTFVFLMVALASAGTLVAWGNNGLGQCDVPEGNDFVQVATCFGAYHSLALRADGTVEAWGHNNHGQCNVPEGLLATQIAVGENYSMALKTDGSIVVWGDTSDTCPVGNIPSPNSGFVLIAAGYRHAVALRSNGVTVAWGNNTYGQCNIDPQFIPVQMEAGYTATLLRYSGGNLEIWGMSAFGLITDLPTAFGFSDISLGWSHGMALKIGVIHQWGDLSEGVGNIPAPNSGFTEVEAGQAVSAAVRSDGSLEVWGNDWYGMISETPTTGSFSCVAVGQSHCVALQQDVAVEEDSFAGFPQLSLSAFPNPSNGYLEFSLTNGGDIDVYDVSGRLVSSVSIPQSGNVSWTAPTTGVYFASVRGSDSQATRFVVVR